MLLPKFNTNSKPRKPRTLRCNFVKGRCQQLRAGAQTDPRCQKRRTLLRVYHGRVCAVPNRVSAVRRECRHKAPRMCTSGKWIVFALERQRSVYFLGSTRCRLRGRNTSRRIIIITSRSSTLKNLQKVFMIFNAADTV